MKNNDLIESLKNTYCFYRQKYVMMSDGGIKTVNHPYGDQVIESHLEGRYALAVFAGEKVTKFISVDVDAGGKKAVRKVVDAFEGLGIPREYQLISTSGQKGFHVDIFFTPWIYNDKARNLYDLMIWRTGLDPKKVEFRPTNTQAIKIPLGVHAKTGNRCWFLDGETLEPIEDFGQIRQVKMFPGDRVREIVKAWNKKRWNELYAEMVCEDSGHDSSVIRDIEFNDEYYEGKRIVECGTRHDVMLEIACDLRTYGANRFQIAKALRGFYYRQDKTMIETTEQKVLEDIEDISQWAEESVPVKKRRPSPAEGIPRTVEFHLEDAERILAGSTGASRRIALLIYAYCKMFGANHMSYDYIVKIIGCSVATVKNAISDLVKLHIINRKSGGCHFRNGRLVREANTYFIPSDVSGSYNSERYEYNGRITSETINELYYRVMAHFFPADYLAKRMTKPELEECMKWR